MLDSLFWIIGRISENPWIDSPFDSIITCDDNSVYHGMDEVVIEHIPPNCLHELTPAVGHELVALGLPVWVPTCNPTFERVWKLQKTLINVWILGNHILRECKQGGCRHRRMVVIECILKGCRKIGILAIALRSQSS